MKTAKQGNRKLEAIKPAALVWRNGQPYSGEFDDMYFSPDDGRGETRHVFIDGNRLPERWETLQGRDFTIAETGFGAGLNFLMTCRHWLARGDSGGTLHYLAIEKHPLKREDLDKALRLFAESADLREALLERYPPLTPGFHRLVLFGGRVSLSLVFGDIAALMDELNIRADAWFLDGFAPAKNPAMWSPAVLQCIGANTAPGGTFATFTAAGEVRRGLQAAGFDVGKREGYGRKREMLCGIYRGAAASAEFRAAQKPWFHMTPSVFHEKTVAVIGAGLAGAFTADALARRGWDVTVIDRHPAPAGEASGNALGVIYSKFSAFTGPDYAFYQSAYLHSVRHFPRDLPVSSELWDACGVLQLAFDAGEQRRQAQLLESGVWPEEVFRPVDARQASELAGISLPLGGLYFGSAGWVAPRRLCEFLLRRHASVRLLCNAEALSLEKRERGWRVRGRDGIIVEAAAVVLANAADARLFTQTAFLPLGRIRGQVTPVAVAGVSRGLRRVLCYDGYLTPAVDGRHGLGATFDSRDKSESARLADDTRNLDRLRVVTPGLANAFEAVLAGVTASPGRVGFRCHTPDYLPVVGPAPDPAGFGTAYAPLAKGQLYRVFPPLQCLDGLYLNIAHGARGVTSTPLCAEMIAAYLGNEPQPLGEALRHALHPVRFLVKALLRK